MRNLVLWGHSLTDYQQMFNLKESDLSKKILEYGSGPTSFNVDMRECGHPVVSVDSLFDESLEQLQSYTHTHFDEHAQAIGQFGNTFKWGHYGSLETLITERKAGLEKFFADYHAGRESGRYVKHTLPFPYEDFAFDLILASHALLADEDAESIQTDIQTILELARVGKEVRMFPLLNRDAKVSEALGPVMLGLQAHNLGVEIASVPYHLQNNDNAMMRVWANECPL